MANGSQESRVGAAQRLGLALAVLCGAPFVASMDLFVVNVAFTDVGASFPGHSLADLSWILNGYAIVYAALLVPLGRWADAVGNRRGFLLGLGLFTAASAAAAASPTMWVLVAVRALQAVGAAALTPTSLGLLIHTMPPERRAAAVRTWAAAGAVASALGPVVGGALVELSWRWIFLINVPIGLVLIAAAARVLRDHHAADADPNADPAGAALLVVGVGSLALALVQAPDWGWGSAGTLTGLVLAAVALVTFAIHNAGQRAPLLAPELLRVRSFAWSNAAVLLFSTSFGAALLGFVLWVQQVWGYSAIKAGLAMSPGPLMVPVFAAVAQSLAVRVRARWLALSGNVLWGAGAVWLAVSTGTRPAYLTEVLPGWLLCGVGAGLALPTLLSSATAQLPPARSATGSAVVAMTRQTGTVLGVSVLVAVLGTPHGAAATRAAYHRVWWVVAAIALAAATACLWLSPRRGMRSEVVPDPRPEPAAVARPVGPRAAGT